MKKKKKMKTEKKITKFFLNYLKDPKKRSNLNFRAKTKEIFQKFKCLGTK